VKRRSPASYPISSCSSEPRIRPAVKPSPSSTPLAACRLSSANARRPSSLRSHCTWLPIPTGRPVATTSTIPPSVSPAFLHSSISAMILRSASGSATRTCDASVIRRKLLDAERCRRLRFGGADTRDVAEHVDSERRKNLLGETADRDSRGGLARRRAFEHVANVFEIIFQHAGQVGVVRPRAGDRHPFGAIVRIGGHLLDPILEVAIFDYESDRTAERFAKTDPETGCTSSFSISIRPPRP